MWKTKLLSIGLFLEYNDKRSGQMFPFFPKPLKFGIELGQAYPEARLHIYTASPQLSFKSPAKPSQAHPNRLVAQQNSTFYNDLIRFFFYK
jgi:hypothetical protein